jgi:hypothetical protein
VQDGDGPLHEATFALAGVGTVRQKIVGACSSAAATPDTPGAWR